MIVEWGVRKYLQITFFEQISTKKIFKDSTRKFEFPSHCMVGSLQLRNNFIESLVFLLLPF